jgi:dienelactone hydrolase
VSRLLRREWAEPEGVWIVPDSGGAGTGVLVLAGSSGAVDVRRATLLAEHGATALSIRWFGGPGQPTGICEVPLETFASALDALKAACDRVAILGVSKGAEAALLLAVDDPAIDVVVAFAPTDVVWANVGPGLDGADRPCRSSWTRGGRPLPFVPYDDEWRWTGDGPPAYVGSYVQSRATFADRVEDAAIPAEAITADVVLVAGGDDQVWPSVLHAEWLVRRRAAHGLETTLITHPEAGHRLLLPGEQAEQRGLVMARGGSPQADAALGERAWPVVRSALGLSGG